MKPTLALACLSVILKISAATVVFGAIQTASEPEGAVVMGRSCLGCHDAGRIEVQTRDRESWGSLIDAMIEKGALVESEEIPVLIDYLVSRHGPLPEGEGKEILESRCTACHNLDRVLTHRVSPIEWEETLSFMINEGAYLSDDEFYRLLDYLSVNLGER